jgi:hypothetical protein
MGGIAADRLIRRPAHHCSSPPSMENLQLTVDKIENDHVIKPFDSPAVFFAHMA